jgi:hypothetical protein
MAVHCRHRLSIMLMLAPQVAQFLIPRALVVGHMLALLFSAVLWHCAWSATAQSAEPRLPAPPQLAEFRPLTKLPWSPAPPHASLLLEEGALRVIFLEPDVLVRYQVLASYLRCIPAADLGRALDLCIEFEGGQTPEYLVPYFISIWAERDPRACLERVKAMFKLVVPDGWLAYDHWAQPRMDIRDLDVVRGSRFWLEGFPADFSSGAGKVQGGRG